MAFSWPISPIPQLSSVFSSPKPPWKSSSSSPNTLWMPVSRSSSSGSPLFFPAFFFPLGGRFLFFAFFSSPGGSTALFFSVGISAKMSNSSSAPSSLPAGSSIPSRRASISSSTPWLPSAFFRRLLISSRSESVLSILSIRSVISTFSTSGTSPPVGRISSGITASAPSLSSVSARRSSISIFQSSYSSSTGPASPSLKAASGRLSGKSDTSVKYPSPEGDSSCKSNSCSRDKPVSSRTSSIFSVLEVKSYNSGSSTGGSATSGRPAGYSSGIPRTSTLSRIPSSSPSLLSEKSAKSPVCAWVSKSENCSPESPVSSVNPANCSKEIPASSEKSAKSSKAIDVFVSSSVGCCPLSVSDFNKLSRYSSSVAIILPYFPFYFVPFSSLTHWKPLDNSFKNSSGFWQMPEPLSLISSVN